MKIKPIFRMYLHVIIVQFILYASIFYVFESISTTNNPTRFMIFWIPAIFSVFVSLLLVRSLVNRIRRNGVKEINYGKYIVSVIREVSPPLLNKDGFIKEIEKDNILNNCHITAIDEDKLKLIIPYSIFLKEVIFIDFNKQELRLCAEPSIWYIYGPYGGGVQKIGYLESVIQDHYKKE